MPRDILLVTGASSDLGLALVRRLYGRPLTPYPRPVPDPPLVLAHCYTGLDRVEALRAEVGATNVVPLEADLGNVSSVITMAERIEAEHGAPSQFLHLPGLKLVYERFPKFSWDHFHRDLSVQLQSAVVLLQRFLPKMAKMPRAKVVFVLSSVTRGAPPKFMSMYTVVKYAELGLMKALASEYAGTQVTVNAVSPSMIETRFIDNLPELAIKMSASNNPRGRNATPEDVIGALVFLLSPDSDYISGAEIPVTAGGTG